MSDFHHWKCICCKQDLGEDYNPNDGLIFTSTGNYGSTIFDPIGYDNLCLVTCICDTCVKQSSEFVFGKCIQQKTIVEKLTLEETLERDQ